MLLNTSKISSVPLDGLFIPASGGGSQSDTISENISYISSPILGSIDFESISEAFYIVTSSIADYRFSQGITEPFSISSSSIAANLQIFSILDTLNINVSESISKNALKILSESFNVSKNELVHVNSSITDYINILDSYTTKQIFSLVSSIVSSTSTVVVGKFYSALITSLSLSVDALASYNFNQAIIELFSTIDLPSKVQQEFIYNSISTLESYLLSITVPANSSVSISTVNSINSNLKYENKETISTVSLVNTNAFGAITELLVLITDMIVKDYNSLEDTITMSSIISSKSYLYESLLNIIKLNSLYKVLDIAIISDGLDVSTNILSLVKSIGIIIESIDTSSDAFIASNTFLVLLDTLTLIDQSVYALFGSISETIEYSLLTSSIRKSIEKVIEALFISQSSAQNSVILVPLLDNLSINSDYSLSSIIQALLSDELLLVLPNSFGSSNYFTYAFSPETSSISTYDNYNFDGACVFKDKYLFFNKTGIYEYGGKFDNGLPIQSEISTSALMYATSNLKSVPSVYLGVVNSDFVILKVRTDGRGEFTYKLNKHTNNLHTQKINVGKGVIGRYFQFDLITSAEDFDLNSIEFLPLVLKRKI
jgi:hypothetical protein